MAAAEICGSPSFFKVIIDLQNLEIPKNFMKKYGHVLAFSDQISLSTSTGAIWQVKLLREKNKTFLQHGWSKFVEFYSISRGQFLVFTYQRDSCFNVLIFDTMTASEIEYPIDINAFGACPRRESDFIDRVPTSSKKGVESPDKILGLRCHLTPDEKRRVDEYHCRHPAFVAKLTLSMTDFKSRVKIPLRFARKYLKKQLASAFKSGTFKIGMFKLGNGTWKKSWEVKCVASSPSSGGFYVQFTTGWKNFALENILKKGDICIFELINIETMSFRVAILPYRTRLSARYNRVKDEPLVVA